MRQTSATPLKLQAALCELMWSQSYGKVTIEAICESAGVKKGSFYHAYPDKSALALDAFEFFWETEARPSLDAAFSSGDNPLLRLSNWLACSLGKMKECQRRHGKIHGCPIHNVGTEISTLEPAVADKITELFRRYRRYLISTLRDAVEENLIDQDEPEEISRDVLTLVEGALAQARISNSTDPIHRLPISVGRLIGAELPEPTQFLTIS